MELRELFEMQRKLDEHIVKEKGLEGQDLLPQKILALQVELGELANEWRGFKFWSKDQEPNQWKECEMCTEQPGYLEIQTENGVIEMECPICEGHNEIYVGNRLLEEYVDCLHFILSIGNDLEVNLEDYSQTHKSYIQRIVVASDYKTITEIFIDTISIIGNVHIDNNINYWIMFKKILKLGERLGFTWEQIVQAYQAKNQVNHARQENGY